MCGLIVAFELFTENSIEISKFFRVVETKYFIFRYSD
jgi:hypothetical protein